MFAGKTLLITGGTGSFGNAVLRRFLDTEVKEIRIFSRDEKKQDDMRHALKNEKLKFYIGDVRDINGLDAALHSVDYVFSAAALKQVPSCEFYPLEAVKTNILGTENVLNASIRNGVKKVICLSTDKAVYPINAMGMSKALMEKVIVAKASTLNEHDTILCGTRYGNVMASRGSVIPLFIQQIKERRPLTITDPNMTRYMMSLNDAVDLVLYAYRHGRQGDIYVQKAPAATIGDLAKALIDIFKSRSEIKIIGTRHGEKKHETLLNREEMARSEDLGDYYRIYPDVRGLNYEKYFEKGEVTITGNEDYTSENTRRLNINELIEMLLKLEYVQNELAETGMQS
jgi:UDP-N-acetylglucosamine 4,6-dehydratase